ncbi:MAG: hypothetical protein B6U95_06905 [Thermofilum sp. ex4484_82]|nr:helix-turn-helix transcriptional regulator [Thermoproteales archaeon]OYT26858.1 MAG: hypothetical protein B6U95_06905 [Thermofilum sp. ex4484_82]OYT37313.1 MAG: hypothetical protein B6U96_06900 [Archaeoglobales archaeon ex4484_92]RLE76009.1 MAG: hypothetical protein DRZ80_01840 [Thermoprotei archaeon]RLE77986.1 MAG: hypothetical protein DRJ44_00745 [Thermoprotei archaeon]
MPSKILSISDALGNPLRRKIFLKILEQPGISLRGLARELEIGMGNLASHILILERVGLIEEIRDGTRVKLYANHNVLVNNKSG